MQLYFLLASLATAIPAPSPAVGEIVKAHTNPIEFLAIHAPQNLAKCFAFAHTPQGQNPGGCGIGGGAAAAASAGPAPAGIAGIAAAEAAATGVSGGLGGLGALLGGLGALAKRDTDLYSAPAGSAGQSAAIKQGYMMTLDMLKQFPGNTELLNAVQDYHNTWPEIIAA